MPHSFANLFDRYLRTVSRRDLFRAGSPLTLPAWLRSAQAAPPPASVSPGFRVGPGIYESVGTRPIINCRGTFTVVDGSLDGPHRGDYVARDLFGPISGDAVRMTSRYTEQHGDALTFTFSGRVNGDSMAGDLDMDEYLKAKWSAARHQFRRAVGA
jgi:hypothetical protein